MHPEGYAERWHPQESGERVDVKPRGGTRVALPGVRALTREDALRRLATVRVGRVAWTDQALPALATVRFYVADGDVVFGATMSDVGAEACGQIVAFATDGRDATTGSSWEVSVVGVAQLAGLEEGPSSAIAMLRLSTEVVRGVEEMAHDRTRNDPPGVR